MRNVLFSLVCLVSGGLAHADNVEDARRILCSASQVMMCFETGECFNVPPWEIEMPQFVVIDRKAKTISTTKAGDEQRVTPINSVNEAGDDIFLQGFEQGRAFSIVINQDLGTLNAAVARDGVSVSVFGACTNADM